jgi:hypothetical protein
MIFASLNFLLLTAIFQSIRQLIVYFEASFEDFLIKFRPLPKAL